MVEFKVARETNAEGGRYVVTLPDHRDEAELAWVAVGPALIAAHHTFVPETMRGKGVAEAMVHQLISDARAESFRCAAMSKRNSPITPNGPICVRICEKTPRRGPLPRRKSPCTAPVLPQA